MWQFFDALLHACVCGFDQYFPGVEDLLDALEAALKVVYSLRIT
jgi:hypothetical protein